MQWLPETLPPHVALIASTLPVTGGCWSALQRKGIVQACPIGTPPSSALISPTTAAPTGRVVPVFALAPEECSGIVDAWLQRDARTLTTAQMAVLQDAIAKCPLPLYIKLAYDRTRHWRSFHDPEEFAPTIEGLVNKFFSDLEKYHGAQLVSHAIGFMCASAGGLSESEIVDLLSFDDDVLNDVLQYHSPPKRRLPPLVWVRLRDAFGDYVVERASAGGVVIGFYHRKFWEVAKARYLSVDARDDVADGAVPHFVARHAMLAKYFNGTAHAEFPDRGFTPQPVWFSDNDDGAHAQVNTRRVTQLPHALIRAKLWPDLHATLCDW